MIVTEPLKWSTFGARVLGAIVILLAVSPAHALPLAGQKDHGCTEFNKEYPFPDQPARTRDGRIIRAEIEVDSTTAVTVTERAASPDDDHYDSEVVVTSGGKTYVYQVPRLVQNGRALRLLRAKTVCGQDTKERLILGFESGWTGARQAFVVVSLSEGTVNAFGTKVLHQGKIVLDKAQPDHFELLSASPKDDGLCGACAKRYMVYDCEANGAVVACKQRPRLTGPLEPNAVTDELIEVR